jgi:hypothetical protein
MRLAIALLAPRHQKGANSRSTLLSISDCVTRGRQSPHPTSCPLERSLVKRGPLDRDTRFLPLDVMCRKCLRSGPIQTRVACARRHEVDGRGEGSALVAAKGCAHYLFVDLGRSFSAARFEGRPADGHAGSAARATLGSWDFIRRCAALRPPGPARSVYGLTSHGVRRSKYSRSWVSGHAFSIATCCGGDRSPLRASSSDVK